MKISFHAFDTRLYHHLVECGKLHEKFDYILHDSRLCRMVLQFRSQLQLADSKALLSKVQAIKIKRFSAKVRYCRVFVYSDSKVTQTVPDKKLSIISVRSSPIQRLYLIADGWKLFASNIIVRFPLRSVHQSIDQPREIESKRMYKQAHLSFDVTEAKSCWFFALSYIATFFLLYISSGILITCIVELTCCFSLEHDKNCFKIVMKLKTIVSSKPVCS